MLSLLLDENIPPAVAKQIQSKRPDIPIETLHFWHSGDFLGTSDYEILLVANKENLTLVTYDTQILSDWAFFFASEIEFSGIVFIDEKTIANNNLGKLIRALLHLWDTKHEWDWSNHTEFLHLAPEDHD